MNARTVLTIAAVVATLTTGAAIAQQAPQRGQRSPEERAAAERAEVAKMMAMPRPIDAVDSVWLEELTWLEARDAMRAGKTTIILTTGGMEQNGSYLALGKHNYVNHAMCEAIARKLGNALCGPNVSFVPEGSIDPPSGHMHYPGSISLTESTFQLLLTEIANSYRVTGFENIVLIGDSGGNQRGMRAVATDLSAKWAAAGSKARIYHVGAFYDDFNQVIEHIEKTYGWKQVSDGTHDDALITAILMTVDPNYVRMKQRIAKGLTKTNNIEMMPEAKAIEVGKAIINKRADITIEALKKAMAAGK